MRVMHDSAHSNFVARYVAGPVVETATCGAELRFYCRVAPECALRVFNVALLMCAQKKMRLEIEQEHDVSVCFDTAQNKRACLLRRVYTIIDLY